MDTERGETLCRYCCEPIDPRAKRCPHCRTQQTRWAYLLHPAVPALLVLSPFVLFAVTGICFHRMFGPGKDFGRYARQLVAVDTRMEHNEEGDSHAIFVSGMLLNDSRVHWEDVEIECRFLDANGNMIDVSNDLHTFAVRAGGSRGFLIRHAPHRPVADYAGCKVNVRWAKEAE